MGDLCSTPVETKAEEATATIQRKVIAKPGEEWKTIKLDKEILVKNMHPCVLVKFRNADDVPVEKPKVEKDEDVRDDPSYRSSDTDDS